MEYEDQRQKIIRIFIDLNEEKKIDINDFDFCRKIC